MTKKWNRFHICVSFEEITLKGRELKSAVSQSFYLQSNFVVWWHFACVFKLILRLCF